MTVINHNLFRDKFYQFTGKNFDLVSTIDHPYASPPIRLIDGHNSLKKIKDTNQLVPLICIWDVNSPDINRYRYNLSFDTGLMNNKDDNFFIFSDKLFYPLQKPKLINFIEVKKRIQLVLENLQNLPKEKQKIRNEKFINNLDKISDIYINAIEQSSNGTIFYQNLLYQIYSLLELKNLSEFFKKYSYSYYNSSITQKWIPYCIEKTKNEIFGLPNLMDKNIFKNHPFRNVTDNTEDKTTINKKNIETIITKIKNNQLIPSYEIFFWTLFLASIKHFGNDYGFFDKLDQIAIQYDFGLTNNLQLTRHNQDTQNIIQFDADKSFSCFRKNNHYIIKNNNPIKTSRISSITALYCHLGKSLGTSVQNIFEKKAQSPKIIAMGKTVL